MRYFIIMILLAFSTPVYSMERSAFDWVDINEFCSKQQNIDFDDCAQLIEDYQITTEKHISDSNNKKTKKLKEAVDDIGNTLREQIIIPDGVRIPKYQQQLPQ